MRKLIKTIIVLRERIKMHRADLSKNETMTRYALIDPLLRELDWELANPSDVVPEDKSGTGGKTDYTMSQNAMIVEAKKLDENLDKWTDKMTKYVRDRDVRYGVLTNGQTWRMYDSQTTMKSPEVEFDITDSEGIVISRAIRLHRSVVLASVPRKPNVRVKYDPVFGPDVIEPAPTRQGDELALPDIKYIKGMTHPKELVCPDKNVSMGSWTDILVGAAEWLIDKKRLDKSHCPVPISKNNAILHTWPVHQNGKQFSTYKKVGDLYLNKNADPPTAIRYAIRLIKKASLQPTDFKVYFEDPDFPD